MSFSSEIKREIEKDYPSKEECAFSELAAIIDFCGKISRDDTGNNIITLETENGSAARKGFTLLNKTYNIKSFISKRRLEYRNRSYSYQVVTEPSEAVDQLVLRLSEGREADARGILPAEVSGNAECIRSYLRGAFLIIGSATDPKSSYHLEFVCPDERCAVALQRLTNLFDLKPKIVTRKKNQVLYLKEGEQISDLFRVIGANNAVIALENARIMKDLRNSVNRQVNCDAANIHKTVSAAQEQIKDIEYIQNSIGLSALPENLRLTAQARLDHPEATIKEIGESLYPPVGKSGVNHRLNKLREIAQDLRSGEKA